MTRLFIQNQEVELDKSVQFAITKQFEDLSNPTTIINDWSKTVSIPFTQKNNNLFGNIYKTDRVIVSDGTDKNTGIYFNPTLKMDFRLQDGDNVIMTGYAKMNEIKQKDGKGTYEITLFGELGKVLSEMKKITFDTSTDDVTYLIDGSEYVAENINAQLVFSAWNASGQTQSKLYSKDSPQYKVTDIIGFAPNNSYSECFKYDTYQEGFNGSNTFENELGSGFTADTGVEPKTIISNGLLPREIGEYRSYLQLPYIYWNKMFQLFQYKAEELTGYKFDLDISWFNASNPYWYNLVYMLKAFPFSKKGELYNNLYDLAFGPYGGSGGSWKTNNNTLTSSVWQTEKQLDYFFAKSDTSTEIIDMCDFASPVSLWEIPEGSSVAFSLPFRVFVGDTYGIVDNPYLNPDNALLIKVSIIGANNNTKTLKFLIKRSTSTITEDDAITVINDEHITLNTTSYIISEIETVFVADRETYGNSVSFSINMQWKTTSNPLTSNTTKNGIKIITVSIYPSIYKKLSVNIIKNQFKSNSLFTLNDLWNNDYNLFDEVIKYCKMYRISISIDDINKKIVFQPFNKYFENYTVEDWTDKVDKSKDFNIVPIVFDSKYILFNYKDSNTKLGKEYNEKFGVNYGDYRLKTEYNFNSETKKLFDDITPSIVNTDNVLSWKNLSTNHNIVYSFPAEIYVDNKDEDNKQIDLFGAYYFHNGLQPFSAEAALNLVAVKISDDTPFQLANNTYFYSRKEGYRLLVDTYPKLDIVNGDNLCVFNAPMENYTYINNYGGKNSIYTNFWEKYINERYNIQNKKITCYVKLTPIEYIQFKWNKFVRIGNQLCMVNKIYDYDISSNQPTKVDLITIQDVTGYTNQ